MYNNNTVHTWKLKTTISSKGKTEAQNDNNAVVAPYGLAFTQSGDLIVADMETAKLKLYQGYSSATLVIDTTTGLQPWRTSNPWQVAVSSDNSRYFLTDHTDLIKVYGKDGGYIQRIATKNPRRESMGGLNSKLVLAGLAVDGKGFVYAGETTLNYISKHQEDGTYVNSFHVSIKPWYIAITSKDHIVVASDSLSGVQVLNEFGNLLHTLEVPRDIVTWKPSGVCCSEDCIFVAALCGVYCYSSLAESEECKFQYKGAITKELLYPRGVAIALGGKKIAVAEEWGVKIFEDTQTKGTYV